uniref:Bromodomain adjacent to zinc finger domain protein 1A n=1 Tax=Anopheles minimus TaxID=112268 RepID=A0A182W5K3_9DIPT
MPLLRRQVLQKTSTAERLRDSEEVLFCQPTGEIFSNYEDYFHRVMLISSMVWSCAMTGRPNLTYSEALESEKAARKLLKTFPAAVKGPFLLVASHTQRTSINEMHEDVYGFVKDRMFKGEIVDAMDLTRKAFRRAVISNVLVDNTNDGTATVMYQVTADDGMAPKAWKSTPGNVKRDRSALTRDKCKLFLKQHVEAGPGGQLRIKADSLAKFVVGEGWTDEQVFMGQAPNFEQSKRLKQHAERSEVSGASKPTKKKFTTTTTTTDKSTKISTTVEGENAKKAKKQTTKNAEGKGSSKVKQKSSSGKQQSIAKYMEKTTEPAILDAKAKKLAEELALQKLKLEQEALAKKRLEEEKALLLQQATLALKKYNAVLEDQELTDQRPMPPVRSVRPLITSKHFGSFVFILEFLNSFSDLLSIRSKFSGGLTMHLLERALILREVNGPLSDIFQVLLSAIFTQQLEEENEVEVGYRIENVALKRLTMPDLMRARDTVLWCEKHYCTKLSEMPIDSMTVSELLRLHFLASGALVDEKSAKHRYYNRGGYGSADDPGLKLVRDYPHILRALNTHSVFHLPVGDVIQILCCLIHQLLTYSGVRELVEERVERARAARSSYQTNRYAQRRLTVKTGSQKNQAREDTKRELTAFVGDTAAREEHRRKLMERLEEQYTRIDAEAQRQMKVLQAESGRLKEDFFDYQIYLGSDRCFRNYWLFESLPGLFVEHDRTYAGRCLDRPTPNIPGLASCAQEQRKKYITKAIMRCAGTDGVAGLLDAKAIAGELPNQEDNGGRVEEVYEQLLTLGSAELERIEQQANRTKPANSSRATSEEPRNGETLNGGTMVPADTADSSTPMPPRTNQELLMCTAQPQDCAVHTENHPQTVSWGYYATADELDALIRSLNVRGTREKQLRETLECERDLILTHIEKCPVEKLSVNESDRATLLSDIVCRNQKRYDAPNFSCEPGTDPDEILEAVFLENLLELEAKITVGYLGVMRVRDRDKWRQALEAATYDPQTDKPLQWGTKRLVKPEDTNGKEKQEQDVEKQREEEEDDVGEQSNDNDSGRDSLERLLSDASNPGYHLPDTTVSLLDETLVTGEVSFPLHESETLRQRVHSFARALLQVAQCIDQKFLRHPFGPKKEHKDRSVMMQKQYQGLKNLVQWETSLMRSTCFAQLFLHYNVLYDAIHWSRSAERICCMICRRKGDPGLTLLCDECNRACHMYCLKPKLKEVPAGDWYCMRCRPENFKEKRAPAKKKKIFKWVEEEEDMAEEDESGEDEGMKQEEEEEEEEQAADEDEEEEEEVDQNEEQEAEQMEVGDAEKRNDEDDEEEEEELSDGSESEDDDREDDGSDEEYRMRKSKQPAAKAAAKAKGKPKPAIVVTSTGRSSRSTAVTNGAYRYEAEAEADDSYDERDERRKRRKATLSNGTTMRADGKRTGAAANRRRAASVTSMKRKRGQPEDSPLSPTVSTNKRSRRSAALSNGGRKMSVSPAAGSDDDPAAKKLRISARSTKGQRRPSVFFGDDEDETVARQRIGGSAARRSRRTGEDLPLNSVALYVLIDDILKHPNSWPFNRPVSAKEVPDYYAVIKNPMDFARIKSKLNMGDYKINEQMMSDVQLVFRNCDLYNTDETDVYRIGRDLEQYVVKRCKELTLPFQPSDMQKSGHHQYGSSSKPVNGVAGAHGK